MYKPNDPIVKECQFNQDANETSWTAVDQKVFDFINKEGKFPWCVFPCNSDPPSLETTSNRTWINGDLGEARIATYTCLGILV